MLIQNRVPNSWFKTKLRIYVITILSLNSYTIPEWHKILFWLHSSLRRSRKSILHKLQLPITLTEICRTPCASHPLLHNQTKYSIKKEKAKIPKYSFPSFMQNCLYSIFYLFILLKFWIGWVGFISLHSRNSFCSFFLLASLLRLEILLARTPSQFRSPYFSQIKQVWNPWSFTRSL